MDVLQVAVKAAQNWLTPKFDAETQTQVQKLLAQESEELIDAFSKSLEFGTGGMRGIMGVGDNRLNSYTIGKATQGLSNYINRVKGDDIPKVVIAYDCRNNSRAFAQIVADVFSANGIQVYLFSDLRPTPTLSFAVRELGCDCGIVLTASHNPPEYNGYKVYWKDGGQIVPPVDNNIIQSIRATEYSDISFTPNPNLIEVLDDAIDNTFIQSTLNEVACSSTKSQKEALSIVFTSLHGTSITMVPEVLARAGFTNVHIVEEQAKPDGNFITVKSPNPEEPDALKLALELAEKKKADIVIGTDPDSDRLGIAVRNKSGKMVLLNGNQSMILMTVFLLERLKLSGSLTENHFIASTLVSTPMMKQIAKAYGVQYKETLTGFKWIAKLIEDNPKLKFVCGGEESFGFMVGGQVRDKDAVASTLLICEMAAIAKANSETLFEQLLTHYTRYNFYEESLFSLTKKGVKGRVEIDEIMHGLRTHYPRQINKERVVKVEDYQSGIAYFTETKAKHKLLLPKSNVLVFTTETGTRLSVRPSGTEPKIKFYLSLFESLDRSENAESILKKFNLKIESIKNEVLL